MTGHIGPMAAGRYHVRSRWHRRRVERWITGSESIPGWRSRDEARALVAIAISQPRHALIVEVGTFMGRTAALLGQARRHQGSGEVVCVDAFDCSGDAYSVPHYQQILANSGHSSLRAAFDAHVRRRHLDDWVKPITGEAVAVAAEWDRPIDVLLLDGDQSPEGAEAAYQAWVPHVRSGGYVAIGNTYDRDYEPGHDGSYRVARGRLTTPAYREVTRVDGLTLARVP